MLIYANELAGIAQPLPAAAQLLVEFDPTKPVGQQYRIQTYVKGNLDASSGGMSLERALEDAPKWLAEAVALVERLN